MTEGISIDKLSVLYNVLYEECNRNKEYKKGKSIRLLKYIFTKLTYTFNCAKDSGGPYDYNMVTDLVNLAKSDKLKYAVDIYPMYGSDVGAALKGGNNIRGALIGPGVHSSHGMERTHYNALENTVRLLYLYLV